MDLETLPAQASLIAPPTGEQRLAAILDGIGEAFYAVDFDWRITFYNRECELHFGRPREEALGRILWEVFPGSEATGLARRFRETMAAARLVTFEDESIIVPGRWMEFRLFPTLDGMGITFRDITERKKAERTLRTYALLVESMTEGVSLSDENGIIVYTNPAEDRMFGYGPGELVGQHVGVQNAYEPEENARRVGAVIGALKERGAWDGEWRNRRKDGSEFVTAARITTVDIEGRRHFLCVQRDVTEAKRAEAALREREAELARVQQIGQVGGLEVNLQDGFRSRRSPEYLRLHGLPPEAEYESHEEWMQRVHPEDRERAWQAFRGAVSGQTHDYVAEYRIVRPSDGEVRWISARGEIERDAEDRPLRLVGVHIDITERRRAEEHRELLIHELNHRVKNTLATVQSIAVQTLRNAASPSQAREAFEGRLMALSRAHDVLTRENWEGARLHQIIARAAEPYTQLRGDRLYVSGPELRLPPRMALAFAMALQELVTNAVKYGALSNETGRIEIVWTIDPVATPARLRLSWEEKGGPPARPPQRQGFGSRLIERSLAQDLDGEVTMTFASTGVVCTVDAPIG
jgi:PAS domain S-box-containing protein